MKKLIQKGKSSTQSIVDDCMEGWDLSEIEVIDNDNNDNNDDNDDKKKNEF